MFFKTSYNKLAFSFPTLNIILKESNYFLKCLIKIVTMSNVYKLQTSMYIIYYYYPTCPARCFPGEVTTL